jgi:hypothetical protein
MKSSRQTIEVMLTCKIMYLVISTYKSICGREWEKEGYLPQLPACSSLHLLALGGPR